MKNEEDKRFLITIKKATLWILYGFIIVCVLAMIQLGNEIHDKIKTESYIKTEAKCIYVNRSRIREKNTYVCILEYYIDGERFETKIDHSSLETGDKVNIRVNPEDYSDIKLEPWYTGDILLGIFDVAAVIGIYKGTEAIKRNIEEEMSEYEGVDAYKNEKTEAIKQTNTKIDKENIKKQKQKIPFKEYGFGYWFIVLLAAILMIGFTVIFIFAVKDGLDTEHYIKTEALCTDRQYLRTFTHIIAKDVKTETDYYRCYFQYFVNNDLYEGIIDDCTGIEIGETAKIRVNPKNLTSIIFEPNYTFYIIGWIFVISTTAFCMYIITRETRKKLRKS